MCDPATLTAITAFAASNAAAISATATVAGAGLSVYGMSRQAASEKAALTYQGQLDQINAVQHDRAARDALERGELDAVKHGREVAALRARQSVGAAAGGLDVGFGTPADIAGDTSILGAQDSARIAENAAREGEGFRINAQNYRADAAGAAAQRANVGTATLINQGSTIVGAARQLAGTYSKYGKRT